MLARNLGTTSSSLMTNLKSPTRLVCPPWMKSSSGGPSSASSTLCSCPMRLMLQTFTRLSALHDPKIVSSNGDHCTPRTYNMCMTMSTIEINSSCWGGWKIKTGGGMLAMRPLLISLARLEREMRFMQSVWHKVRFSAKTGLLQIIFLLLCYKHPWWPHKNDVLNCILPSIHHKTWKRPTSPFPTSLECRSNRCIGLPILRMSHSATVVSDEPVASRNSLKGLNAKQLMFAECACFLLL